jgi:hypothetical protein
MRTAAWPHARSVEHQVLDADSTPGVQPSSHSITRHFGLRSDAFSVAC